MEITNGRDEREYSPTVARLMHQITGTAPVVAPVVKTERDAIWFKRVFSTEKAVLKTAKATFEQTEPFETEKPRFGKIWLAMLQNERMLKNTPDLTINYTEAQKTVINELIKYFINDPTCIYPLQKGIYLCGGPGSGKTKIMECFEVFARGTPKEFFIKNFESAISKMRNDEKYCMVRDLSQQPLCLDEIGYSSADQYKYGNYSNPLEEILYKRHIKHSKVGLLTHCTSNKDANDFRTLIGPRLADRFNECMTEVRFLSVSNRM